MALLSQTDKTRIRQMCEDGAQIPDVAKMFGLTSEDVTGVLTRTEPPTVKTRKPPKKFTKLERLAVIEYAKKHSAKELMERYGIAKSAAHEYKKLARMKEKEPATAATAADSEENIVQVQDNTNSAESQALKAAKAKLLAIYETLSPEECRAWEMGEVYAEVVRGCGE